MSGAPPIDSRTPARATVLLGQPALPDLVRLTAAARGLTGLVFSEHTPADDPTLMRLSSGSGPTLEVRLQPTPYQEMGRLLRGLTSPSDAEAEATSAHLELSATGLAGDPRRRDALWARLTCAVLQAAPTAVAAKLDHGVMFHRADVFLRTVHSEQPGALPLGVCVDLSVAQEGGGQPVPLVTFLTHGMPRYGRQDLYITAPRPLAPDALELSAFMVRKLYDAARDAFATGQEVGRTPKERLELKRTPSPINPDATVVRLDLTKEEP